MYHYYVCYVTPDDKDRLSVIQKQARSDVRVSFIFLPIRIVSPHNCRCSPI